MPPKDFMELLKQPFILGPYRTDLAEIVGEKHLEILRLDFPDTSDEVVATAIEEVIKYLYLSAHSPNTLFFPGNKIMDKIWHALIVETANYRRICEFMRPGSFIDHSNITFDDYLKSQNSEKVLAEQCSWLASYVQSFGAISPKAFELLSLATSISKRMQVNLDSLNLFAKSLVGITTELTNDSDSFQLFTIENFVTSELVPNSNELDANPQLLGKTIRKFIFGITSSRTDGILSLTNEELELLYTGSGAFAFTLEQHLSGVERLSGLPDWQIKNTELWKNLSTGKLLCGIATTQLAKPGGAGVTAVETSSGIILNGVAPFVCGYGLFDKLIVGFQTDDSIGYCMIDYPDYNKPSTTYHVRAQKQKLACFNGTSTVNIEFIDKLVSPDSLVSRRLKGGPIVPRPSKYIIPDLGIGKGALRQTEALVNGSEHPKHKLIKEALVPLRSRLTSIEKLRAKGESTDILIPMRDDFVRDAVRLLGLACGGTSLYVESLVARLQKEILILDITGHSPQSLKNKIAGIGRAYVQ